MSWLVPSIPSIPGWSRTTPARPSHPKGGTTADMDEPDEDDLDAPPQFPLPNSHQRSLAPSRSVQIPQSSPSFALSPPSPTRPAELDPPSDLNIAIIPDPIPLGDMAPPPSTTKRPDFGMQAATGTLAAASKTRENGKAKRMKVALGPGYSALDWSRLTQSGMNLRGTGSFPRRITEDELKKHNTRQDAWSAFNGMVYNITPYMPYHPGGQDQLMRVAGRDGTKLFMLTHSWVNLEYMLQECMVGMLVKGK